MSFSEKKTQKCSFLGFKSKVDVFEVQFKSGRFWSGRNRTVPLEVDGHATYWTRYWTSKLKVDGLVKWSEFKMGGPVKLHHLTIQILAVGIKGNGDFWNLNF